MHILVRWKFFLPFFCGRRSLDVVSKRILWFTLQRSSLHTYELYVYVAEQQRTRRKETKFHVHSEGTCDETGNGDLSRSEHNTAYVSVEWIVFLWNIKTARNKKKILIALESKSPREKG